MLEETQIHKSETSVLSNKATLGRIFLTILVLLVVACIFFVWLKGRQNYKTGAENLTEAIVSKNTINSPYAILGLVCPVVKLVNVQDNLTLDKFPQTVFTYDITGRINNAVLKCKTFFETTGWEFTLPVLGNQEHMIGRNGSDSMSMDVIKMDGLNSPQLIIIISYGQ